MPAHAVPFFANPDDTHCFQASFRMILKYFLPERDFSWEELERMSAKVPGMSTWPEAMLMRLHTMGFEVAMIESFDAAAFIKEGEAYLRRAFGDETAAWQVAHSDIPQEQRLYRQLLDAGVPYVMREPTFADLQNYLSDGWLVTLTLNSARLNGKPGYSGHAVVVYEITPQEVAFNDPGPPATPERRVPRAAFEAAWADPNAAAKDLIAIRLNASAP